MIPGKKQVVLDAKGEPIVLSEQEKHVCSRMQRVMNEATKAFFKNSLGFEISVTTLTSIQKKVSTQKFFELPPADYMPLRVGEGAFSDFLTTYRSFDIAGNFEDGVINSGGQNARLAVADAGIDALTIQVNNWAKGITWTIFELEQAARSGNWDLVSNRERSRLKNWQLGIQRVAFLGLTGQNGANGQVIGLLNQPTCAINTTVITKKISSMTTAELKTFCATVVDAYRTNCNRTAWPTHFTIPESDYNGLASQASADFPVLSVLQLLKDMFAVITRNKDFEILPCAYGDAAYHADVTAIAGKQVYALYNYDEESLRMDLPVDYTGTLANSLDNFAMQNTAYGQFTGVLAYRPLELLYFQY